MSKKKTGKHHGIVQLTTSYCLRNWNCQFLWPTSVFIFHQPGAAYLVGSQGPGLAPGLVLTETFQRFMRPLYSDNPACPARFIVLITYQSQVQRCKSFGNKHLKSVGFVTLSSWKTILFRFRNKRCCNGWIDSKLV